MSVSLTATAEADLNEILDYIAEHDGVGRALRVHARIRAAFNQLATEPKMGHCRPDLTGSNVRWWRVLKFLVLYEPAADGIMVLRIIHGARDVPTLLENGI